MDMAQAWATKILPKDLNGRLSAVKIPDGKTYRRVFPIYLAACCDKATSVAYLELANGSQKLLMALYNMVQCPMLFLADGRWMLIFGMLGFRHFEATS